MEEKTSAEYNGKDLEAAINVMELLNNGNSFEEAKQRINDETSSGLPYENIIKIITRFSKIGTDFYRYMEPNKSQQPEEKKYLNMLDAFSRLENKLAESVGTQLHENWRTARKIENEEKYEPRWKKMNIAVNFNL